MSSNPWADVNPYQPVGVPGAGAVVKPLPGALQALAIVGIVLGTLGALAGCGGVVGAFAGPAIQRSMGSFTTVPGEAGEAQARMLEKQTQLLEKYMLVNSVTAVVGLGLSVLLIVGAILTLQRKPIGRKLFLGACLGAMAFELMRAVPTFMMQTEMGTVMEENMTDMMKASSPKNQEQAAKMGSTVAKTAAILGIIVAAVMMAVRLGFHIVAVVYLRSERIRTFFPQPSRTGSSG